MKITVKLFATLRTYSKENNTGVCNLELPENSTINQVIEKLRIPAEIPKILLINGIQKQPEDVLNNGDTLSIFPPIAGG